MAYVITDKCIACGTCESVCPVGAISEGDGKYNIDQIFDGETVEEVLDYVQYNPKKLVRQLEQWVTKSVKEGKISLEEGKEFLATYRNGLFGYTYLQ